MRTVILLGAQGAGKGTYAALLTKKYNHPHISTGDIFREAVKLDTPLGREVKEDLETGRLVPDDIVLDVVEKRIKEDDCKDGLFFDGFPRNRAQAEALDKITKVDHVIVLDVTEEVVLQRIGGRIQCRKCAAIFHKTNLPPKQEGVCDECGGELYTREDDQPEAIKKRLGIYYELTQPLMDYYKDHGVIGHVDATNPHPPEVVEEIVKILGE